MRRRRGSPAPRGAAPSDRQPVDQRVWERLRALLEILAFVAVVTLIWIAIPLPAQAHRHGLAPSPAASDQPVSTSTSPLIPLQLTSEFRCTVPCR